jgi:hypothetical protein
MGTTNGNWTTYQIGKNNENMKNQLNGNIIKWEQSFKMGTVRLIAHYPQALCLQVE